jgi:Tetratricopeptide repeat
LCERSTGPDSREVADALHHLGSALSAARRYDDALKALERSLQLKQKTLGAADVSIARTLEEIGLVLQRKGDYERAGTLSAGRRRSRKPRTSIMPESEGRGTRSSRPR